MKIFFGKKNWSFETFLTIRFTVLWENLLKCSFHKKLYLRVFKDQIIVIHHGTETVATCTTENLFFVLQKLGDRQILHVADVTAFPVHRQIEIKDGIRSDVVQ